VCITANLGADWQLRANSSDRQAPRRSCHVRFAPIATEIRRRSESTRSAISDRMHCSKTALSFDHVVGELLEMQRYVKTERLRSVEIDHQLEPSWVLNGKFARFRTP
jgi:hypothetical protein